jgi:hypothetical protein
VCEANLQSQSTSSNSPKLACKKRKIPPHPDSCAPSPRKLYSVTSSNCVYLHPSSCISYCHVYGCDSRRDFGLEIGFIDNVNTQHVITLNYSVIANFHTLQTTSAHTKSLPASSVFTGHFLVTALNNGYCSASGLKFSLNGGSLPNASACLKWFSLQTLCMDRAENTISNVTSIVACVSIAAGTCLLSRCL